MNDVALTEKFVVSVSRLVSAVWPLVFFISLVLTVVISRRRTCPRACACSVSVTRKVIRSNSNDGKMEIQKNLLKKVQWPGTCSPDRRGLLETVFARKKVFRQKNLCQPASNRTNRTYQDRQEKDLRYLKSTLNLFLKGLPSIFKEDLIILRCTWFYRRAF